MENRPSTREARFDAVLPTLATKSDIEALRADIRKWIVATMIGLFIGFCGLFIAMTNILRPAGICPPPPIPCIIAGCSI